MQAVDLDDVVGVLHSPVDVSPVEETLPGDVVPEPFVQDGRVWTRGFDAVDDHRQGLVFDLHQVGCIASDLASLRQNHNDGLTLVPHAAHPEEVLVDLAFGLGGKLEQRFGHRLDFVTGERGDHAAHRVRLAHVHGNDLGVGVGRAHEVGVTHAVHPFVVNKGALRLEKSLVLLAGKALAGPGRSLGLGRCRSRHRETSCPDAALIALTMLTYPVHRQRLPWMPARISSSVGVGLRSSRKSALIRIPDVQ